MRKGLFILLISIISTNLNSFASAGLVDLIQLDGTTHNYTGGGNGLYSIDGDYDTYQGHDSGHGEAGTYQSNVYSEHIFDNPRTITQIDYRLYGYGWSYCPYHSEQSYGVAIEYTTDGENWNIVSGTEQHSRHDGSGTCQIDTGETTWAGTLNNVKGIRAYARGYAHNSGDSNAGMCSRARIYEIQAYGQVYDDIGIRIKTSSETIKIGVEDLDDRTHKLRIRKGDKTYGIPLLATDDSNASPVRIYDGKEVKALPKTE